VSGGLINELALGRAAVGPVVGKQVVDRIGIGAQDDAGEDIGEICLRIDAAQLAGFDERGEGRPVFGAQVMAGK
jgi:hypothetical protein